MWADQIQESRRDKSDLGFHVNLSKSSKQEARDSPFFKPMLFELESYPYSPADLHHTGLSRAPYHIVNNLILCPRPIPAYERYFQPRPASIGIKATRRVYEQKVSPVFLGLKTKAWVKFEFPAH